MAVTRSILILAAVALALVVTTSPSSEASRKILSTGRKLQGADPGINAADPTWYYVELQVRSTLPPIVQPYHHIATQRSTHA